MAVAVIGSVLLLTCGVVAGSDVPGTLSFFGVTVHTTSAQIFLTGAICTWALLAAAWLLTAGIRRSRERGAQLAMLRGRVADVQCGAEPPGFAGQSAFAGLLGLAVGGERPGADRAGSGSGGDRDNSGQDTAEQPPVRQ
ncbi:hypothetical protein KGA66_06980 [Actinocrinis puniceicyclus]|uniref:Uncharacterized protein n=1 Tax=Actinocrinis puniceicyclus TaxID=977794 RepID=A0A8J7WNQ0_9ACTN|nr:hypothetical protein [Actinocrinis puniceicyclus]MBS2962779.1 hypothetical protein [Actinocrinis puniceicyclus]